MAATNVREIRKAAPAKGLSRLIDQAGKLNALKNDYEQAYNKVRGDIALSMPLGDNDEVNKTGEEYEARHFYPVEKTIDPERLWEYCRKRKVQFWGFVKVSLQNAQSELPAEVFHNMVKVKNADVPRLLITKIKRKKAA